MFLIIIVVIGIIFYLAQINSRINILEEKLKGNFIKESAPVGVSEIKPTVEPVIEQSQFTEYKKPEIAVSHQDTFAKNLARFGITILVLGIIFFLKYIDSQGLIGPVFKYVSGLSLGVILLGIAEYLRSQNKHYTNLLRGGAFIIMYITAFVGYILFHIVSLPVTLTLISIVLIISTIISFKENDFIPFTVGVGGAYLTTFSLLADIGVNKDTYISVLLYLFILNIAILFVSLYKTWIKDVLIGFVSTWIIFSSIFYVNEFNKNILFIFATLYGLQYLIVFLIQDFKNAREKVFELVDSTVFLTVINTLVYTTLLYQLIVKTFWFDYVGYIVAILGVFHLAIYAMLRSVKDKQNNIIDLTHFVVGVLLLSASVSLQFDGPLVTMIWFLEGVVLSFMTVLRDFKDKSLMYILGFSAVVAGIMHMIIVGDYKTVMDNGLMFINQGYIVWFAVFLLINLVAYIWYGSVSDSIDELFKKDIHKISFVLIIIGQVLFIGLTSFEIQEFGSYRNQKEYTRINQQDEMNFKLDVSNNFAHKYDEIQNIDRETTFMQLILFIIMTIIYFLIGLIRKNRVVRNMGIITLIITTALLIGLTWELGPVYRIITFVGFGIALLIVSYLYISKNKKIDIAKTLILLILLTFSMNIQAKVVDIKEWSSMSQIKSSESSDNNGLYILPIKKDILDRSKKNDLSDIRIIDKDNNEIPYIIVKSNQNTQTVSQEKFQAKILENSLSGGGKKIVVIDTGREGLLYNKVIFAHDIKDINFRKIVKVYISDVSIRSGSTAWKELEQKSVIYNYTDKDNFSVEKTYIDLNDISSRYIKFELTDDDEFSKDIKVNNRVNINKVEIQYQKDEEKDLGVKVKDYLSGNFQFDSTEVFQDIKLLDNKNENNRSSYIFDGGINIEEITINIDSSDTNFNRNVVIQGSNDDINWLDIGNGNIYRIDSPIYKGEKTSIKTNISTYKKIKVIIQDNNDKPLNLKKYSKIKLQNNGLLFKLENIKPEDIKVVVGNNTELAPVYDIRNIINYFEDVTPKIVDYDEVVKNPKYNPAQTIPFGERNKVLLNIGLIIFIVIIGIFGFFWMKKDKINE